MSKKIGIPKETLAGETRVAATPKTVSQLIDLGFEVLVEHGAGVHAAMNDEANESSRAQLATHAEVWACPTIIKVTTPTTAEAELVTPENTLITFFYPDINETLLKRVQSKKTNG